MNIVEFPNVFESFQRAVNELLTTYIKTDDINIVDLSGVQVLFQPANIVFDIAKIMSPVRNTIAVLYDQELASERLHCESGTTENKKLGFQQRKRMRFNVYIAVPIDSSEDSKTASKRQAVQIYDNLATIVNVLVLAFNERNIYHPELSSPKEAPATDEVAYIAGTFTCELRYDFVRSDC